MITVSALATFVFIAAASVRRASEVTGVAAFARFVDDGAIHADMFRAELVFVVGARLGVVHAIAACTAIFTGEFSFTRFFFNKFAIFANLNMSNPRFFVVHAATFAVFASAASILRWIARMVIVAFKAFVEQPVSAAAKPTDLGRLVIDAIDLAIGAFAAFRLVFARVLTIACFCITEFAAGARLELALRAKRVSVFASTRARVTGIFVAAVLAFLIDFVVLTLADLNAAIFADAFISFAFFGASGPAVTFARFAAHHGLVYATNALADHAFFASVAHTFGAFRMIRQATVIALFLFDKAVIGVASVDHAVRTRHGIFCTDLGKGFFRALIRQRIADVAFVAINAVALAPAVFVNTTSHRACDFKIRHIGIRIGLRVFASIHHGTKSNQ